MSSRSRRNRRQFLQSAACLLAAPLVGACQMQPLYGTSRSGESVKQAMADVEIGTIPGRVGQRLRNELIFFARGGAAAGSPGYRLEIAIREWEEAILVEQTGDAQGILYNLEASFELYRIEGNEVLLRGRTRSREAFDKFEPIFTNVRARLDAENRAARMVADSIRTQIAAFLAAGPRVPEAVRSRAGAGQKRS